MVSNTFVPEEVSTPQKDIELEKNGKNGLESSVGPQVYNKDNDSEEISSDVQAGVQAIEAITSVWTRKELIIAYVL